MSHLTPDDFGGFFHAVHGYDPFPWQKRLLSQVAHSGRWPEVLDLPTSSGKTAAIDVAVFHLALQAEHPEGRSAPMRIAFVVDRRLVVDDAFERAKKIAARLRAPAPGSVLARVADRLKRFSGDGPPLVASRLRGGVPREDDWARTPSQPTVLCSTVDQIGSRLLFRGYGVSERMAWVHAGLVGSDCLILLDEAHLAEPFRQTLNWVAVYRDARWRRADGHQAPWGLSLLTATPAASSQQPFTLDGDDYDNEVLARRLNASKPARLVELGPGAPAGTTSEPRDFREADIERIGELVSAAVNHLGRQGLLRPAVGVVVNRVRRARAVFEYLKTRFSDEHHEHVLLIGPARPVDRNEVAAQLAPIRTRIFKPGETRALDRTLIVVATQCVEVGVDIDLDGLITEAAPIDALRQRFGRVNRAGRDFVPYGAIVTLASTLHSRYEDPVYGKAIKAAWEHLLPASAGRKSKGAAAPPEVDFGITAFAKRTDETPVPPEALSESVGAPVLLPAHLDLLSQTSPVPNADPDVGTYLHGTTRQPDSVSVIWRGDLEYRGSQLEENERVRRLLLLMPPRSTEAIELPVWAVRRWLEQRGDAGGPLADIAASEPGDDSRSEAPPRPAFRWKGDDERSSWVSPGEIRPGDTIVVPCSYGGLDEFGWHPERLGPVDDEQALPAQDVADRAAWPFAGRRFVVRVSPELIPSIGAEALANALASAPTRHWRDLRDALRQLALPETLDENLRRLDEARRSRRHPSVVAYDDVYGYDEHERPRGVVFVAHLGLDAAGLEDADRTQPAASEDDAAGSLPGFALPLEQHCVEVEAKAIDFARRAGLPDDRVCDLGVAGYLHDAGKLDSRFQAWLHFGDPLGPDPDRPEDLLAKSPRPIPRASRGASGLPERWRHEALSVRLAPRSARFADAKDPALVLWLIGTHHGHGLPFYPGQDPDDMKPRVLPNVLGLTDELAPDPGPQSLAFDWCGLDWASLTARLKERYGVWELARMQAILRLADHRASEEAERAASDGGRR